MKAELHLNMAAEQEVSQEQLMSDVHHIFTDASCQLVSHFYLLEVSCLSYTLDKIHLDW